MMFWVVVIDRMCRLCERLRIEVSSLVRFLFMYLCSGGLL